LHPNVAILPWSFVAENVTKPLLGAEGATEQEFTVHVGRVAAISQGALGMVASHVTVALPDRVKPGLHENDAILP